MRKVPTLNLPDSAPVRGILVAERHPASSLEDVCWGPRGIHQEGGRYIKFRLLHCGLKGSDAEESAELITYPFFNSAGITHEYRVKEDCTMVAIEITARMCPRYEMQRLHPGYQWQARELTRRYINHLGVNFIEEIIRDARPNYHQSVPEQAGKQGVMRCLKRRGLQPPGRSRLSGQNPLAQLRLRLQTPKVRVQSGMGIEGYSQDPYFFGQWVWESPGILE